MANDELGRGEYGQKGGGSQQGRMEGKAGRGRSGVQCSEFRKGRQEKQTTDHECCAENREAGCRGGVGQDDVALTWPGVRTTLLAPASLRKRYFSCSPESSEMSRVKRETRHRNRVPECLGRAQRHHGSRARPGVSRAPGSSPGQAQGARLTQSPPSVRHPPSRLPPLRLSPLRRMYPPLPPSPILLRFRLRPKGFLLR